MLQDYKLGIRMLLKYPGLTLAGGLALAIAIGVGAGWYDVLGKVMSPTIPLPEGDRLVVIDTQNTLTNEREPRVVRDFLEWRRSVRTIESLGAYRTATSSLVVGNGIPEPIQVAELTATAFTTARVVPMLGRGLLEADEVPGAPSVIVFAYDLWQRVFGSRADVVGSVVKLGDTQATVIGVMPKGFAYPFNHDAWAPLPLRTAYEPLEGGAIDVIGRLMPGVSLEQANSELRLAGERTAAAFPATHEHLRPRVRPLAGPFDDLDAAQFTVSLRNLPVLLMLSIACLSVGTLIYARTATRESEIAIRSAVGASRARIIGQLFVEALVLAMVSAAIGLVAADKVVTWGIESLSVPFWVTPGLKLSTIAYAAGLAVVCAAMLSLLPAVRATRARVQPHLANLGSGGATLRFGRVWTGAMVMQIVLTAMGIPAAMETASQTIRKVNIRAAFPSREYVAARVDLDRPLEEGTALFAERRSQTLEALASAVSREPGVVAVIFSDRSPGSTPATRFGEVAVSAGEGPVFDDSFRTMAVGPGFFEAFDRRIVAGRGFNGGDWTSAARTAIVNEAFARSFSREMSGRSPVGARIRYRASTDRADEPASSARRAQLEESAYDIVGVVSDFGLDPDDSGDEVPFVFHTASAGTVSPLVLSVRVRGNPAPLVARLPVIAAGVDARLSVREAQTLSAVIRERDDSLIMQASAFTAVIMLILFLSALGIFSLVSVGVARRTREIGLRTALGANPRQVLSDVLSRALVLMGSGVVGGGALLLWLIAIGAGPSGRPTEDVLLFSGYLAMTSAVMLAACVLACIGPARRALRINPTDALREA